MRSAWYHNSGYRWIIARALNPLIDLIGDTVINRSSTRVQSCRYSLTASSAASCRLPLPMPLAHVAPIRNSSALHTAAEQAHLARFSVAHCIRQPLSFLSCPDHVLPPNSQCPSPLPQAQGRPIVLAVPSLRPQSHRSKPSHLRCALWCACLLPGVSSAVFLCLAVPSPPRLCPDLIGGVTVCRI